MQFANWFSIPTNRMVVLIDGPPQQIGWLYNYNYFKRLEFYFHFFDSGGSATRWCQHKYLANLPGHTMALALKYRLLCGSVVVSSPLMYHEWYYSSWLVVLGFTWFSMWLGWSPNLPFFVGCLSAPGQLKDQEHFVSVDFTWSSAADVLAALRGNPGLAEGIGARAREWAESHLTEALEGLTKGRGYQMVMWEIKELSRPTSIWPLHNNDAVNHTINISMNIRKSWIFAWLGSQDGFDCYWLQLIRLAQQHFPAPQLSSASLPIEAVALGHGHHALEGPLEAPQRQRMDVITVIPARAKDVELMDYARSTWLGRGL